MSVPEAIKTEAARIGHTVYVNVLYEALALAIRDRLNRENPRHNASIGLMPDDSYVVWYRNLHDTQGGAK
jgi:hypothetical protein